MQGIPTRTLTTEEWAYVRDLASKTQDPEQRDLIRIVARLTGLTDFLPAFPKPSYPKKKEPTK